MKERPILFNTEMVQAILEGRKTQTRRAINLQPPKEYTFYEWVYMTLPTEQVYARFQNKSGCLGMFTIKSPYGKVGDKLWVRETWAMKEICPEYSDEAWEEMILYKADYTDKNDIKLTKWKPSIFMPKKYCRIWLEIINIRVERVQDIDQKDAIKEGIKVLPDFKKNYGMNARGAFMDLWESINEKRGYGWNKNPWVWVIEFKKL